MTDFAGKKCVVQPDGSAIAVDLTPAEITQRQADDTAWQASVPFVERLTCICSPSIGTTSTAFSDVAGMSLSVLPNANYQFDFMLVFQTAALTTGIGLALTAPASPTLFAYQREIATTLSAINILQAITNDGTAANTASIDAINANRLARIWGVIHTGAAGGLIQLRFKSEVNGSQVQIRAGSPGLATRVV